MSKKKMFALVAASSAVMLMASGCASGAGNAAGAGEDSALSFQLSEPKSLVPHEDPGSQVAMATCANLMEVNTESQELEPLAATSVTSDDAQHWKIELQDGWTFQDGAPVTADSFAKAWNKTATGSNAWQGNGSFTAFEGYKDLNPADGSKPKATELSGVKVVDDQHLEVALNAPNADFPKLLSTSALCPLPEQAFSDPEAYEENPISNGPYQFVSWNHNEEVVLEKWDDFKGADGFSGGADKLTGQIYTAVDAAYTDMTAGNLDMIRNVPATMVSKAKSQLGEDSLYEVETGSKQYTLQIPEYIKDLRDPDLRRAISMSIDRESIAKSLLQGYATPSDSLVPPSLDSYEEGACDSCTFDADEAKKLLAKAGGFDGTLVIEHNSASDQQLVQAIAKQIKENLGIKVQLKPVLGTELQSRRNNQELDGAVFGLWGWSYKSPDQYLSQYETGGDGNETTGYSNKAVDKLVRSARASQNEATAAKTYAEAESLIVKDMPAIPLFIPTDFGLHTECADMKEVQGDLQFYRAGYGC
ncbi:MULTISPECIES: peptide ABC transporter substrate-binding protein [Micrococcaceae]|nr:ABC transporter substrate-binding protein [Glutamicibacter sp. BW78]PCC26715.1 hypothetical protein CIK75_01015 [Glutamicibacter sp. BW78]